MTQTVLVDLDEVIGLNLEGFLDLLTGLTGTDMILSDIHYRVVGVKDGLLEIEVTADEVQP